MELALLLLLFLKAPLASGYAIEMRISTIQTRNHTLGVLKAGEEIVKITKDLILYLRLIQVEEPISRNPAVQGIGPFNPVL